MIDHERHVGGEGLTHRLAVLIALGNGEEFEVFLDGVCDSVQHACAFGHRGLAPRILRGVGGIERKLDVRRR